MATPIATPMSDPSSLFASVLDTPESSRALSRASSTTSISENHHDFTVRKTEPIEALRFHAGDLQPVKKICCVGAGYVGGPTMAVIAFANPEIEVTVVDMNQERIDRWRSRHLPIHEPSLNQIVRIARDGIESTSITRKTSQSEVALPERGPNLFFSTDCDKHISEADIVFLSVNTPTKMAGIGAGSATNISIFESAARSVARVAKAGAIIVEKSTVPCRTAQVVRDILDIHRPDEPFEILSNPEFLAEGTAVEDLLKPSRVLIGSSNTSSGLAAAAKLARVYSTWVPEDAILSVHLWSSELAKLVANAMLAQRISSINAVSAICEKTGADIAQISKAVGLDHRIGSKFLHAGLGFGGSCFRKDVLSLSYLASSLGLPEVSNYWKSVIEINEWQCERYVQNVIAKLNGSLNGKKITILGYAFKKDTADTRESQSIRVIEQLLRERPTEVAVYDPRCFPDDVESELQDLLSTAATREIVAPSGPVRGYADPYEACSASSAILVLTDWDQFRYPTRSSSSDVRASTGSLAEKALLQLANVVPIETILEDDIIGEMHSQIYRPEPACAPECGLCQATSVTQGHNVIKPLRWEDVVLGMEVPRWVFDGRGVVEPKALEALGFRVESVGKVGTRSRLNGFDAA